MAAQVMAQATTSPEMSRKQHRACSQHRLKLEFNAERPTHKNCITSTYGAVENRPTLSFCYAVIEKMLLNLPLRLLVLADLNSTR
jgi:hypothetical protein